MTSTDMGGGSYSAIYDKIPLSHENQISINFTNMKKSNIQDFNMKRKFQSFFPCKINL